MDSQTSAIEKMQHDHRTWLAAHAQWRQDIERWQKEHKSAVARLAEMQKVIREHGECLDEHAKAIRKVEEATAAHEREITEYQAGTSKKPQDLVANSHQVQEGVFSQHQNAHERIGKHHDAVMTKLNSLESAAASAM